MSIKFENKLLSIGLVLMLYQVMVRSAVVKPLNSSQNSQQIKEVVPQTAANTRDEVIIPILSANPEDNPDVPYFQGFPNYPHVQLEGFNEDQTPIHDTPEPLLRRGDEFKDDRPLPNEEPDYYDSPHMNYNNRQQKSTKKPKKLYKAIERVYFYPQEETDISRNKEAMNQMKDMQMKDIVPESYEPYYNSEDPNDANDGQERHDFNARKDFRQMDRNPARQDFEDPEDQPEVQEADGTQTSIAQDVKEFGNEAVEEAKRFDQFLDNLRNFEDNSEKEYSSPQTQDQNNDEGNDGGSDGGSDGGNDGGSDGGSDGGNDRGSGGGSDGNEGFQNSERTNFGERIDPNPSYRESLAAQTANNDPTPDYEKASNYGNPEEYDSERRSYQNQREQMDRQGEGEGRGGHRYHKDRRRPRKPTSVPDEMYEQRNHEVSGLIDSEPEEGDYLSNYDVVKQLRNSEQKYNTGIEPIYSSQRDFDEVKRLEKMIENVALLNKQKEKSASNGHDRQHEANDGSETKISKVKTKKSE